MFIYYKFVHLQVCNFLVIGNAQSSEEHHFHMWDLQKIISWHENAENSESKNNEVVEDDKWALKDLLWPQI